MDKRDFALRALEIIDNNDACNSIRRCRFKGDSLLEVSDYGITLYGPEGCINIVLNELAELTASYFIANYKSILTEARNLRQDLVIYSTISLYSLPVVKIWIGVYEERESNECRYPQSQSIFKQCKGRTLVKLTLFFRFKQYSPIEYLKAK